MRQYVFHSELTPEGFCRLLPSRAQRCSGGGLLVQVRGREVRLTHPSSLRIYGQIPFVGRVEAEEGGCAVTGGFPVSALLSRKWLLGLWLLVVVAGCLFGVPLWLMAVLAAAWLALSMGLILLINQCMAARRRRVLEFLEQEMKK